MRNLILFLAALPLFAAGTVTSTLTKLADSETYVITVTATADANDASFPVHYLPRSGTNIRETDGFSIVTVETDPGSTAPTDNWDLTITSSAGLDLMNGQCVNRDTANTESCSADPVPLNGPTALNITGNSVNSATITIRIYLTRQTVAKRGGSGGSGSGTVAGTSGLAACFDSATSVGDCSAGTGVTIAGGVISGDPTVNLMFTSDTADASGSCTLGSVWIRTDNGKMWACNTPPTWVRFAELDANGRIVAAMMPALTGDVTTSAGAVATSVVKIQGRAMASTAPSDGQAIVWNNGSSTWEPGTVAGGSSLGMFGHVVTSAITGSANVVFSPYGYATPQSVAAEGRVAMEVPAACTVRNLRVKESVAQPSGGSLDVTIRVNGSDSAVTCSVAVAGTTCSDTSNTASITAGQMLSVHTVNNSSSATNYTTISFQCN